MLNLSNSVVRFNLKTLCVILKLVTQSSCSLYKKDTLKVFFFIATIVFYTPVQRNTIYLKN